MVKQMNVFLPGEPTSHLGKLVVLVHGLPALLGNIDVESFKHFSVVVVRGTKKVNIYCREWNLGIFKL
jgi:hypothetical protein